MNEKNNWFEEEERKFEERENIFTGYDVPDTFGEYILNSKNEKRRELCLKHSSEEEVKKNYTEWLEEEFKGFNTISLDLLDDEDELYPIYKQIAGK